MPPPLPGALLGCAGHEALPAAEGDLPLVELECGGTVLRSKYIKVASKNPNFLEPIITIDVVSMHTVYDVTFRS